MVLTKEQELEIGWTTEELLEIGIEVSKCHDLKTLEYEIEAKVWEEISNF